MTLPNTSAASHPRPLHIDDGRTWRGGQQQVALLAEGLARRGVAQAALVAEGSPLAERLRDLGVIVAETKFRGEWDWHAPRLIRRLASERGLNILHAHTSHAHSLVLRALAGWSPRRDGPAPAGLVTRRVDFELKRGFFSRHKYADPRLSFIAISGAIRDVMIRGGVAPDRVRVVHSGVAPISPEQLVPRAAARAELGLAPDDLVIGAVGSLTDHKDHRALIDAAPAVLAARPDARFVVLGEGELRAQLQARIDELGLGIKPSKSTVALHASPFTLLGFVPDARLKLAALDLFVSSSHMEGLGTAILDAMFAGVPVVATAAGGSPEAVRPGETGRLAPPRNPAALAAAILEALDSPPEVRAALAARAREVAQAEFSADAMTEGNLAIYRELAPRASASRDRS